MTAIPTMDVRTWAETIASILFLLFVFKDKVRSLVQARNDAKRLREREQQDLIDSKTAIPLQTVEEYKDLAAVRLEHIKELRVELADNELEIRDLKRENRAIRERFVNESQEWLAIKGTLEELTRKVEGTGKGHDEGDS